MTPKGLLIVTTNPPPDFEEELNDWYDTDHIAERLSVPGFETGRRYYMLGAPFHYLALYDVQGMDTFQTPDYLALSGDNVTPWTRRVISRGRFGRWPAVQLYPGNTITTTASRLLLLRFRDAGRALEPVIVEGARRNFPESAAIRQVRVFATETDGETADIFVIVEGHGALDTLLDPGLYGEAGGTLHTVSLYSPF